MIDKSKDKVGYLKDRFNDCIKNGYDSNKSYGMVRKILKNDIAMIENSEDIEYYAPGSKEEASIIITDLFYLLGSVPSFITFMEIELK